MQSHTVCCAKSESCLPDIFSLEKHLVLVKLFNINFSCVQKLQILEIQFISRSCEIDAWYMLSSSILLTHKKKDKTIDRQLLNLRFFIRFATQFFRMLTSKYMGRAMLRWYILIECFASVCACLVNKLFSDLKRHGAWYMQNGKNDRISLSKRDNKKVSRVLDSKLRALPWKEMEE